jgi:hypothetical protein
LAANKFHLNFSIRFYWINIRRQNICYQLIIQYLQQNIQHTNIALKIVNFLKWILIKATSLAINHKSSLSSHVVIIVGHESWFMIHKSVTSIFYDQNHSHIYYSYFLQIVKELSKQTKSQIQILFLETHTIKLIQIRSYNSLFME